MMTLEELKQLCILIMCCDPWPVYEGPPARGVTGPTNEHNHETIIEFANEQAEKHNFEDWIDAYHNAWKRQIEET